MLIEKAEVEKPKDCEAKKFTQQKDGSVEIQRIFYEHFTITTKSPNNTVLLKNGVIGDIESMSAPSSDFEPNDVYLKGKALLIDGPAFEYPVNSALFNIYKWKNVEESKAVGEVPAEFVCEFKLNDIKSKMMSLSAFELEQDVKEKFVIPLLHCENYNREN